MVILSYPILLLTFWYKDSLIGLLRFFSELNIYLLHLLSIPLLLRTFFKPIKMEYRDGLIGFSIMFGVIVKSVLLSVGLLLMVFLIVFEVLFFFVFLLFPLSPLLLLLL